MKQREKILLAGLLTALVVWQGWGVVTGVLFGPIRERTKELKGLQAAVEKKQEEKARFEQAITNHEIWAKRSLPPDVSDAAVLYYNWLIQLVDEAKINEGQVTPMGTDPTPKGNAYYG